MEEKRRLPSWMINGSTTNKVIKTLDADTSSVITSDEVNVVTKPTKPKAKGVTRNRKKDISLSSGEDVLVKCETTRKKRRVVEKDVIECRNVEKRKRERVKRKDEEAETSRKKNKKSYDFDSGDEAQGLSCDEEDDDLTMDDVLSIAKEFVENEKRDADTGQQKSAQVRCEVKSESSYARSPKMQEEKDYYYHEPVETTSKVTLADSMMTGDPAQDMLDLFLGPLLKKPIVKAETSSIKDVIIPQQDAAVVSSKAVTFTKKKSSLRDAVAMLLES